jgi:predicted transcriptional regulator
MKHRSRTDIIAKILELASDMPISKTRLIYMTFTSYEQANILIPILVKNDLLGFNEQTHQFHTTAKGQRYLELYGGIRQSAGFSSKEESKEKQQHQQQLYKKRSYWQTELRSLGVDPKGNNELNDPMEIQNLADAVKISMYQDYKTAYSNQGTKHREEAESTTVSV